MGLPAMCVLLHALHLFRAARPYQLSLARCCCAMPAKVIITQGRGIKVSHIPVTCGGKTEMRQ